MNTYVGRRLSDGDPIVYKNGQVLLPERAQRVWKDAPDGFEWGDSDFGAALLALALLLEETTQAEAWGCFPFFALEVIAGIPAQGAWVIDSVCIDVWLEEKRSTAPGPPTIAVDKGAVAGGAVPAGIHPASAGNAPEGQECVDAQA